MELRRHILPSSFSNQDFSSDGHSDLLKGGSRQPLTDSSGNYQLQGLTPVSIYHDNKEMPNQAAKAMYSVPTVPTVPSVPSHQSIAYTLDQRRQRNRRRRPQRYYRNPIIESAQYQAYRARQTRDGNSEDQKWPGVLEIAFLDALCKIPKMGRRKFSYNGRPHGRNELITKYLWIAYLQSLPPGVAPDELMRRSRKQVSSHIQVLKSFFKDHPAYHQLFPPAKAKNGFEDSFRDDPCLIALSEGRLPTDIRYDQFEESYQPSMVMPRSPMKPTIFWLLITSRPIPTDANGRGTSEKDLEHQNIVAHKYTGLSSQMARDGLLSIPNWRQRYPRLERLYTLGDLECDIIHMDVSLSLMTSHPPEGAELVSRTELSIPGRQLENCVWQISTSLIKPSELCRDRSVDPPVDEISLIQYVSATETETHIKVPFPAKAWAHALTCLTDVQLKYDDRRKKYGSDAGGSARSAREYVEKMSMYQEVQSASGPGMPFERRAIILWTFHKSRDSGSGETTWRYLDPSPPRRSIVMSPSPHARHQISAIMNETFHTFMDTPLHFQQSHMQDSFRQGLVTPPSTAGLQAPFGAGEGYGFPTGFDVPPEDLFFSSTAIADSESTLVETDSNSNIDNYLSNSNMNLHDYDHNSSWQISHSESFDADPAWANYNLPSGSLYLGGLESDIKSSWTDHADHNEHKNGNWVDIPVEVKSHSWPGVEDLHLENKNTSWHDPTNPKNHTGPDPDNGSRHDLDHDHEQEHDNHALWTDDTTSKHDWTGPSSPAKGQVYSQSDLKHTHTHVQGTEEHNIEVKLLPWINGEHDNQDQNLESKLSHPQSNTHSTSHSQSFSEVDVGDIIVTESDILPGINDSIHHNEIGIKEEGENWVVVDNVQEDTFNYVGLAKKLKA